MNNLSIPAVPPNSDLGLSNFMNSSVTVYRQTNNALSAINGVLAKIDTGLLDVKNNVARLMDGSDEEAASLKEEVKKVKAKVDTLEGTIKGFTAQLQAIGQAVTLNTAHISHNEDSIRDLNKRLLAIENPTPPSPPTA